MNRLLRCAVPLMLMLLGTTLLIGCLPFFGSYDRVRGSYGVDPVDGGVRPEEKIGKADSDKPIRLARSGRERVIEILGEPNAVAASGRATFYTYNVIPTQFVCAVLPVPSTDSRYLRLTFAEDGTLEGFKVYKSAEQSGYNDAHGRDGM